MSTIRNMTLSFEALVKSSGGMFARMVKAEGGPAVASKPPVLTPPKPLIIKALESGKANATVEITAIKSSAAKPVQSAKVEPEKAITPDPDRYAHLKPIPQAPQIFTDVALPPSGQLASSILAAGQKARAPTSAPPIDTTTAHGITAAAIIAAGKKRRGEA